MFSKSGKWLGHLLLVLASLSLIACGLNVGDEKKEGDAIKLDGSGFTCMTHITEYLEAYLGAELSAGQTAGFYDCLKRSFGKFQKYTRGADKDSYLPEELKRFLETNFLTPRTISPGLMGQAMNLKVALLGGDAGRITRDEFGKLNGVLEALKNASVQMQPYMKAVNPEVGLKAYPDYKQRLVHAREAGEAAMRVAQFLGREVGEQAKPYKLEHAQVFLVELSKFLYNNQEDTALKATRWGELITTFKPVASGGSATVLEPDEWGDLLQTGFGWFVVYLRYGYQRSGGSLMYGPGLEDFVDNVGRGLHLTQLSLNRQPEKVVKYEDLEQLLYRLKALDLMPKKFTAYGASKTLRPLFDRILGDVETKPKKRSNKGLSKYALAQGAVEFYRWSEIQFFLDRKFTPGFRQQSAALSQEIFGFPTGMIKGGSHQLGGKMKIQGQQLPSSMVLKELERVRTKVRPFFRQGISKTILAPQNELADYQVYHGFHNLSVMNIVRGLVRLLVRGYAEDLPRALDMVGLTGDEMDHFFKDMKYLGKDLKFMDPRNIPVLGHRSFMEGNVFTFIGNGIVAPKADEPDAHLLVFEEGLELASLVYSGGNLNDELYALGQERCETGSLDIFGRVKVERECFRKEVGEKLGDHLVNLPKMKEFWQGLTAQARAEAYSSLENTAVRPIQDEPIYKEVAKVLGKTTAVKKCSKPFLVNFRKEKREKWQACLENNKSRLERLEEMIVALEEKGLAPAECSWVDGKEVSQDYCQWIESGEIGSFSVILHYVEAIMTRYDTDANGLLETNEAWASYKVFRGLIAKLVEKKGYTVAKTEGGEGLSDEDLRSIFKYILKTRGKMPSGWQVWTGGPSGEIAVDRLGVIKIFSAITGGKSTGISPNQELLDWQKVIEEEEAQKAKEQKREMIIYGA